MNLNIIGNGFDLYHGLPSSYYYFGCYLIKNEPEFYEEIGKIYNFSWIKSIGPAIAHDYKYVVEDIFWREFEKHLGDVDEFFIIDTHEDDLGLEYNDPVDIEMNENEIAERLKRHFVNWVIDTLDKEENYNIIERLMKKISSRVMFNDDDYFIEFNYTHMLQRLYKISDDKIHYVHGECLGEDDDELIIGHGNNQRIDEIKKYIEELEKNYDFTQKMSNNINEYYCLLRYIESLKKDVSVHSKMCNEFYEKIDDNLDYINVYGLSLGEVDIPYLQQIRLRWPNSKWNFSYYYSEDEARIVDVATTLLNLNEDEYETFYFSNSLSNKIRDEIIKTQNIIMY
ncbi:AbiH family protein [Clostridium perfringens]|uniref:AbiH family protein n=1 Tax=Clostridium perfringens TaxID=1502 RepID=UPI0024BCBD14|nr:AbiH family protein [Clostridium perfringens]MDK0813381.1 AbiH family protein [Clostridium perfringens]MDK0855321.1 AbiH family protein [Clostridium perfringens]